MVLTILKWVGGAMLLSVIALWLWQGGYWKIAQYAEIIPNPLSASTSDPQLVLPGQPTFWEVPDTTSAADEMEYGAADYENPRDALYYDTYAPTQGGNRSPYAGYVRLQPGMMRAVEPKDEYVIVSASGNSSPISLAGWSLKSVLTGERAVFPLAASPFVQGVINAVQPIVLRTGEMVIVSTGASPVGVSFRESSCTGYLAQTQTFVPALANACSRPTNLLPRTPQNEAIYGTACLDYVERLPQCSYPTLLPNTLSNACRSFLTNTFTYTGCVQTYGSSSALGTWRAYLASGRELWRESYDVIQLLDSDGRIVDTLSY